MPAYLQEFRVKFCGWVMVELTASSVSGVLVSVFVVYVLYYFFIDTSVPYEEKSVLDLLESWALSIPIQRIIMITRLTNNEDLAFLVGKIISGGLYAMLAMTLLCKLGVDTSPLVAGIGITGFTIGFALKEIATNFLSGMLLVLDKSFHKGQYLKVLTHISSLEGVVESIDARYVRLRAKNGKIVMVPAAMVYSSPIMVGECETESEKPAPE